MKTLVTLEDHDSHKRDLLNFTDYPVKNGIACPKCGQEMEDVDGTVLMCWPAKTKVHCPACDHKTLRIL